MKYLPFVLLGLALAVVLLAVRIYKPDSPAGPAEQTSGGDAKMTLADQVMAQATDLLKLGQYGPARDLMVTYVQHQRNDLRVRPLLVETYLKLGQRDEAEQTVNEMLVLAPKMAQAIWLKGELMRLRADPKYMDCFRSAADNSVDATPEIWGRYGLELVSAGREADAEKYLRKAVDGGNKDVEVLAALGQAAFNRKDYKLAQEVLAKATAADHSHARAWATLAEAHKAQSQPQLAERVLVEAIGYNKQDHGLQMAVGRLRLEQQRWEDAAAMFAAASASRAYRPEASLLAGRCYLEASKPALAMKYVDIAAELRPQDASVAELRAKVELARFGPPGPTSQPVKPLANK